MDAITDVSRFSDRFLVRRPEHEDIEVIPALCSRNDLYYRYCPPLAQESIILSGTGVSYCAGDEKGNCGLLAKAANVG